MFRNIARTRPDGFPEVILPFGLIARNILQQRDGSFVAAWKYQGPDLHLETEAKMASVSERLNSVIRLGAGWMTHFHVFRASAVPYQKSKHFPDPISALIEEERAAQAQKIGARLETEFFASLTYLPPTKSHYKAEAFMYGDDGGGAATKSLATFQAAIDRFENVFGEIFHAERLGSRTEIRHGRSVRFNDLLAYYRRCLTHVKAPFVEPEVPVYLNDILGLSVTTGERPSIEGQRIAVVSIDGFPSRSIPSMLANLDSLGFPYRWSTRAILLSREQGAQVFKKLYQEYRAGQTSTADKFGMGDGMIDTDSVRLAGEAEAARANVKSGDVQACIYNGDIVILHEDGDQLRSMAREAMKCIAMEGFSSRLETVNTFEAWLGTLPGDGYSNVRRVFMDTMNLADLAPTSAVWTGREYNPSPMFPPNSPPLLTGKARGDAPFRFHAHAVSDVGNIVIAGGMGMGKSTLLAAMAAQWLKNPRARVIALDRRLSMWPLCQAVGGAFYEPGSQNAGFCPLSALDKPGEIEWAAGWLEDLCELNGLKLSNHQRTYLHEGLTALASREPRLRTLGNAASLIQDEEVRLVLRHFSGTGAYAHLFDAERDSFEEADYFNLIETQYLMNLDDKARVPAILYIAHRIEGMFDGRPTLLLLDEAVFALDHPRFLELIKKWLCTLRKENVALVIAVQQLAYLVNSSISSTLLGECPTKIFPPNPDALTTGTESSPGPYEYYTAVGLNDKVIEAIRSAVPKRDYVIDSPLGTGVVNFDLGPVTMAFCGINGEERREELRSVIAQSEAAGRDWRADWLRRKGLPKWATYLESLTGTPPMEVTPLMIARSAG
jgi:type IV secretion system protein VirB4